MMQGSEKLIKLYEDLPAVCQEYDPRAPQVAERIAKIIISEARQLRVEHIGSTAIPDCAGKGVIDLMILYPEGFLEQAREVLDNLGFQRQTSRDPFPEERPMRIGAIDHAGSLFRIHAHVISTASPEAAILMAFRDRLRSDAALRADYIAQKRHIIASGTIDPVDYSMAKESFIKGALESFD